MTATDVASRARSLVSFPGSRRQISAMIEWRDSNADLVAEALKSDLSLCARLLKLASSAYCGYSGRIDNLRQAIVSIGVRQIPDLMAAILAVSQFKNISPDLVDCVRSGATAPPEIAEASAVTGQALRVPTGDG